MRKRLAVDTKHTVRHQDAPAGLWWAACSNPRKPKNPGAAWLVKRTASAVIGVIILAAIVLFAINATDWLQGKVAEDVGALAPPIQKTLSAPTDFSV